MPKKQIETKTNNLPLSGIRVLDFCQMWAGPHATEWLSVMGAEVIKVETSIRIDYMRTVGASPGKAGTSPNVGSAFASLNWGKKSIALNMTTPRARELAKKLIAICDVVAENFGGGVLERWGLSFNEMKKIKPDIIYYARFRLRAERAVCRTPGIRGDSGRFHGSDVLQRLFRG